MEKRAITKPMKTAAFPNSGKELNRVPTCFLIVELALMERSGLTILSILSGFRFIFTATISKILHNYHYYITYPAITIKKSIKFHGSLK